MGKTENGVKVERGTVDTITVSFREDDNHKEVAVTEWINGEGFDVSIDSKQCFCLTHSEANALKAALSAIHL